MADQTVEIKLVLRDELTRQLQPIIAQVRQLGSAIDTTRPTQHMERFGNTVQGVRRELSALSQITFGGLIGGGVVAGIVATGKALSDMANRGLQLRYTADALGVTSGMLNKFSDAMMGLGRSREQGASSIEAASKALRELSVEGGQSNLFRELERAGGETGRKLAREMAIEMAGPRGLQGGLEHAMRRMAGMSSESAAKFAQILGLGPGFGREAARDYLEILGQLPKRLELSHRQQQELAKANASLEISWDNIKTTLSGALLPVFARLSETLDKFLQSAKGEEFKKQVEAWGTQLNAALKEWLEGGGLTRLVEGLGTVVSQLHTGFVAADAVLRAMGVSWPALIAGLALANFAASLASIARLLIMLAPFAPLIAALTALILLKPEESAILKKLQERNPEGMGGDRAIWDQFIKPYVPEFFGGTPKGKPQGYQDEGTPKTDSERRADIAQKKLANKELTDEFKNLEYDLARLNDFIMPGGPDAGFRPSRFGGDRQAPPGYGAYTPGPPYVEGGPPASHRYNNPGAAWPSLTGLHTQYGSTGYDILKDKEKNYIANFNEPELGAAYNFALFGQKFVNQPLSKAMRTWSGGHRGGATGYDPSTVVSPEMLNNPDWAVPYMMATAGDEATKAGLTEEQMRQGHSVYRAGGLVPYSTAAINRMVGEPSPLESMLAGFDKPVNGSATVNIDVAGLGQPARNPADLFKPQPLGGVVQMQNVPRPVDNSLSFN